MKVLEGRNINDLYEKGLRYLLADGILEGTRNGPALVAPGPVVNVYQRPRERVLFSPIRDANPFFHLMEALWMLAGRNDAYWPTLFNKQMASYANEAGNYDGAYGYRWRSHFKVDQILHVVKVLKDDPESRRAVIAMYDPYSDLRQDSKDIPCNTHIYFDCRGDRLNMTVCCRSNDAIWGAYGANVVHMSMLQEFIAAGVKLPVGKYRQFSNNFHAYHTVPSIEKCLRNIDHVDMYITNGMMPYPMVANFGAFTYECEQFIKDPATPREYANPFFYFVARPMYLSWLAHKKGDDVEAMSWAKSIEDGPWRVACMAWIERRMVK